jgi:hypothetical protein
MPTVMRFGPFRFFFYSNEGDEPPHIHVRSADGEAKFWLEPFGVAWSQGLNDRQINQVARHIRDNLTYLVEAWNEYFGG